MNSNNETIVSGEMMKRLRDAGMDSGYEPVPPKLQKRAEKLLNGAALATMDAEFKKRARYLQRKARVKAANRRHEEKLREARERLCQSK
jgi:hypothetical protein